MHATLPTRSQAAGGDGLTHKNRGMRTLSGILPFGFTMMPPRPAHVFVLSSAAQCSRVNCDPEHVSRVSACQWECSARLPRGRRHPHPCPAPHPCSLAPAQAEIECSCLFSARDIIRRLLLVSVESIQYGTHDENIIHGAG